METKSCNLTENEVKELMRCHAMQLYPDSDNFDEAVERIKYLNSRLKAFDKSEAAKNENASDNPSAYKPAPEAKGW